MAKDSKIEWTHHTANRWWGCTKVHEGCDNCYAEYFSDVRYKNDLWGKDKPRKAIRKFWTDLANFQKAAAQLGEIHRVFVGSMMDIFEKPMPLVDSKGQIIPLDEMDEVGMNTGDLRDTFFGNISRGLYPNLMFLLLTKRPSNINKYIPEAWKVNPPENVMFGTSPVNQETYNKLVRQLMQVRGKLFLSIEPQLGSIDLVSDKIGQTEVSVLIDWIIQGGESGHNRRPFNTEWAYWMHDQCKQYGIPYFFKQIDKVLPIPENLMIREFPQNQ
ncbi:DUF5131 family protein [Flavobacterium sp. 25HG05S-40]|uniref:DUF5131 family protein n=1 Tax=Flavobacterium sp. 25HG05S-40 TaxID=3458682 RepID=UPI004044978C